MSKAVAPRDTKLDSGWELTNSNLFPFQGSSEKETRRLYRLKPDNRRISLDRKSRQAFSDHETFTKRHKLNFHSEKHSTVQFCASKRETRPEQFQLARGIRKKGGSNSI